MKPAKEDREAAALAQMFHETYERLAPRFGYETRGESAKPWGNVPDENRNLMIAVAREIIARHMAPERKRVEELVEAASEHLRHHCVAPERECEDCDRLEAAIEGVKE